MARLWREKRGREGRDLTEPTRSPRRRDGTASRPPCLLRLVTAIAAQKSANDGYFSPACFPMSGPENVREAGKGWGKPCRSITAIAKAVIRAGAPVYGLPVSRPWLPPQRPQNRRTSGLRCGKAGYVARRIAAGAAKVATSLALRHAQAVRQPVRFLQLLSQVGFSARRDRLYVQTGIRTPRTTIRSEHSAQTDAQTILVQR
jgi:hypothetical protein